MSEGICPVPACTRQLGVTKRGDPWLMCRGHWARVSIGDQYALWRAYRSWQRLERQWLSLLPGLRPAALLDARAIAVQAYVAIRDECVRQAGTGDIQQLEVAL